MLYNFYRLFLNPIISRYNQNYNIGYYSSPFSYLTDGMGKHIMYPDMDVIDLIAEQRGRGTYEGPLAKRM